MAAFDAGYVFSDATLVANTMSEAQIQAFLVQKGSFLANYKMPANRQVPYPCDKDGNGSKESTCYTWLNNIGWNNDQNVTGASAAHVIYLAYQWYGVNPQIMLTTLQKEQSSVTSTTQTRAGQIDWATGYGVPDGSGADYHYYGFAKQVDMAAWQFRWVFEGSGGNKGWYPSLPYGGSMWDVGKTVSCPTGVWETWNGANVGPCITTKITSRTASALYKHNPYRVNKLGLYNIYNNWFDYSTVIRDSFQVSNYSLSNASPAIGETVTISFSLKNNLDTAATLDAVGLAARANGQNRDFGGQWNLNFTAGEIKNFSFSSVIRDNAGIYTWPFINYQGSFLDITQYQRLLSTHYPSISVTQQLAITSPNEPIIGSSPTITATIKNNEANAVQIDNAIIAARFNGSWNRDTAQTGVITLVAGGSQPLAGAIVLNKPGNYTAWVAIKQAGVWRSLSAVNTYSVSSFNPSYVPGSLTIDTRKTPAMGEEVSATVSFKNNLPYTITLPIAGVAGRLNSPYSGINRDFGGDSNVQITAGATWSKTYKSIVRDVGDIYIWPYYYYGNSFYDHQLTSNKLTSHTPDIVVTAGPTLNPLNPSLGQSATVTASIKNNEPASIRIDSLKFVVRFDSIWNRDTGLYAGTLSPGESVNLNGSIYFNKSGSYNLSLRYRQFDIWRMLGKTSILYF